MGKWQDGGADVGGGQEGTRRGAFIYKGGRCRAARGCLMFDERLEVALPFLF
jgi:predicted Ser/Thr protein kinase